MPTPSHGMAPAAALGGGAPGGLDLAASDRLLVLAPHPDDETFAGGVLLQRAARVGAEVRVLYATDGDNVPWVQRLGERRLRIGPADRARLGARRRGEALAALALLGIPPGSARFLGRPDQSLTSELLRQPEALIGWLAAEIGEFRPGFVLLPSPLDLHPDHSALGVVARLALDRADAAGCRPTALWFGVHVAGGGSALPSDRLRLVPSREERDCKRRALLVHRSQLFRWRPSQLAFAFAAEDFVVGADAPAAAPHPVQARADGSTLVIEVRPHARLGAFGRTTLWLAGGFGGARLGTTASGPRQLRLDAGEIPGTGRRFLKLERRFGFFDEAGWRELPPFAEEAAGAPAVVPVGLRAAPGAGASTTSGVCVIVPCYNVAAFCGAVVREAARYAGLVLALDDGSSDATAAELHAAAAALPAGRVRVVSSPHNRGKGAALLDGFRLALGDSRVAVAVTLDGDRQHRPEDIPRLVEAARAGADLVTGARGGLDRAPLRSRFGNALTAALVRSLYPEAPPDTQCGFRAHTRRLLAEVVRQIPGERYQTELRILLLALGEGWRVTAVPIPTVYLDGNRASHFAPVADSLRIYRVLLPRFLRRRQSPPRAAVADATPLGPCENEPVAGRRAI